MEENHKKYYPPNQKIFIAVLMNRKTTLTVPIEKLTLEALVELIESGAIQEEMPFELIAEQFPELLVEWYPGFPGSPREITDQDIIPCPGEVRNGYIILFMDGEDETIGISDNWPDGNYVFFLKQGEDGVITIITAAVDEEEDENEALLIPSLLDLSIDK